jgi:hypothetical protein
MQMPAIFNSCGRTATYPYEINNNQYLIFGFPGQTLYLYEWFYGKGDCTMTSQRPSNISVSESGLNILMELKNYLQENRARIYEAIRIYPSPIPACDVQFNHLLEERARLSKELNLVDALLAKCYTGSVTKQALKELIAFSNHIDDEMVERLKVIFNQIGY